MFGVLPGMNDAIRKGHDMHLFPIANSSHLCELMDVRDLNGRTHRVLESAHAILKLRRSIHHLIELNSQESVPSRSLDRLGLPGTEFCGIHQTLMTTTIDPDTPIGKAIHLVREGLGETRPEFENEAWHTRDDADVAKRFPTALAIHQRNAAEVIGSTIDPDRVSRILSMHDLDHLIGEIRGLYWA